LREQYCGSECQKLDWKIHKAICPILKKLTREQQPYNEAMRLINEILASKKGDKIRVLEHLLLYADHQFARQSRTDYSVWEDGQNPRNWDIDTTVLHKINKKMASIVISDESLDTFIRGDKLFPYYERSLAILNPWLVRLDSNTHQNSVTIVQINYILPELASLEQNMALLHMVRNQCNEAEGYCQRYLDYSRRFRIEGEEKTTSILKALGCFIDLREQQGDKIGAVTFSEEAYNLVVDIYEPGHPQVQEAAGWLIDCLIQNDDLELAEIFAQESYNNLRDFKHGIDQESEVVASGIYNLAVVIKRQGLDLIKAEKLIREAIRIIVKLYGSNHGKTVRVFSLLGHILQLQGNLEDETKELFQRCLAISIRDEGPNGMNTAVGNLNLGHFYQTLAKMQYTADAKREQFLLAKVYLDEAHRIQTQTCSPTQPNSIQAAFLLSTLITDLSSI
jgi:tetratricopeptide (TPR) repeat protein